MAKVVMNDEWSICDVWDFHAIVIGFTTCMSMSMTTGGSHRSCLNYLWPACHWKRLVITLLLLLTVSHSSRSNSWRATSWRHNDGDHDDGDHGVMPVTRWSWSPKWRSKELCDIGHIMSRLLFDCMWCLSCFSSCLLRTTVVNKVIPHTNFKKCSP